MAEAPDTNRWIGLEEALSVLEARLGVPNGVFTRPRDPMAIQEGEMMWFSDQPILVRETPLGVGFDRGEFEAVLQKVNRVDPGGA
jgi:hypothetical protein